MEEEVVVADNITQQLVFLSIDIVVAFVIFGIVWLYYKYGKKWEVLNKFLNIPIVQMLLADIKNIGTNVLKLKAKKEMKKRNIGENSEAEEVIPPELIKKYGEAVKSLSKESMQRLKEKEKIE